MTGSYGVYRRSGIIENCDSDRRPNPSIKFAPPKENHDVLWYLGFQLLARELIYLIPYHL